MGTMTAGVRIAGPMVDTGRTVWAADSLVFQRVGLFDEGKHDPLEVQDGGDGSELEDDVVHDGRADNTRALPSGVRYCVVGLVMDSADIADLIGGVLVTSVPGAWISAPRFLGLVADGKGVLAQQARPLGFVDEVPEVSGRGDKRWESESYLRGGELIAAQSTECSEEGGDARSGPVSVANSRGPVAFQRRAEAGMNLLGRPAGYEGGAPRLSARERELLALVGQGLTDKQISADLMISLATVRSHLDRIRDKTGQRRRADLTRIAVDLGLLSR